MTRPVPRVLPAWARDPAAGAGVIACGWCLATLVYVLARSAAHGLTFAGPYGALFPVDQLRYLAWIRDAGRHLLIADPYRTGAHHLYLHPLFLLSGLFWQAGLSIQTAYLVWTPVALAVVVWGFARYTGLFFAGRERAAAMLLGVLFFSPLVPLLDWGGIVNANGANELVITAGHGALYWQAWGYLPTVLALGAMPLFLIGVERLLEAERAGLRRRAATVAWIVLAGLLVSWLHPWGGIELILIVAVVLVVRRFPPGWLHLVGASLVAALPLIYYLVLPSSDPAWSLSSLRAAGVAASWWPLPLCFAPLLLFMLPAARWPRSTREQLLVLWPLAALAVYAALGSDSRGGALEGVALPLSILAVRGWRELSLGRGLAPAAVFLAAAPGAAYSVATFHDELLGRGVPYALAPGEQAAVVALQHLPGPVLATRYLAPALPALAGRQSADQGGGRHLDDLFDGRVSPARVQRQIAVGHIAVVISDCLPGRAELARSLRPLGFQERRYGCARLYRRGSVARSPHHLYAARRGSGA